MSERREPPLLPRGQSRVASGPAVRDNTAHIRGVECQPLPREERQLRRPGGIFLPRAESVDSRAARRRSS